MTEYEPIWKGEVIKSMVISSMISQGDSIRLFGAYYVKDLGCHNMFYLAYGYELRPYELKC